MPNLYVKGLKWIVKQHMESVLPDGFNAVIGQNLAQRVVEQRTLQMCIEQNGEEVWVDVPEEIIPPVQKENKIEIYPEKMEDPLFTEEQIFDGKS